MTFEQGEKIIKLLKDLTFIGWFIEFAVFCGATSLLILVVRG